ncbi:hypothetical protein [Lewinella sp. W8]|uniref:mannitol dehydrogenase family protein n=1 Tax=Lewinella sp. W8 TaxID=2528208 RepID=UPI001067450D|nr:hypothetical protein [Lewinella sp. W8]MTB52906.1 hypothetical protein [Lewinella sp. W8]
MIIRDNSAARWALIGGGNFQLAFTVWLLEQLPEHRGNNHCVLIRPTNGGPYTNLEQSRGQFTCRLQGLKNGQPFSQDTLLDRIDRIVYPWEDFDDFLSSASLPNLRFVVSNTTEAGLQIADEPLPSGQPAATFPGKLTQWLYHRFSHFRGAATAGVTLLPLELVDDNGPLLKSQLLHYAQIWELGDAFSTWLADHCPSHSSLVDRIVTGKCPANTKDQPALAVCAEPYFSWSIKSPEPIFEAPSHLVNFTSSLEPIRNAKVRLLNATHTSMVAMGLPRGFRTVREFLTDPEWTDWVRELLNEELYPSLSEEDQPGEAYVRAMLDRLANPYLHHHLADISLNSLTKIRTRIWPAIVDYHQKMGKLPPRLMQAFQSMIAHYQDPSAILRDDARAITAIREHQLDTPTAIFSLLADERVWGKPLPVTAGMFPG